PMAVADALVEPHLAALVAATLAVESVSARVLWGNAGSALAAAGRLVAQARPRAAERALGIVEAVLDTGSMVGTGWFEPGWSFRRRSCCLYYRIPGGGVCGDCVLGTQWCDPRTS
ncbi:MAG: (2Fe-2S)-binding protein, partial [Actinomycetota bacterium]|nr:(2Fe-2S)-binding protein [Actinomycetota bacterium]